MTVYKTRQKGRRGPTLRGPYRTTLTGPRFWPLRQRIGWRTAGAPPAQYAGVPLAYPTR
ncbi:MAG TPA: hypothetical protein G4O00_14495 [Thermoflexia bacterium]|nr:hypothetical protein [Thermoflexia bacterium]